jgi:hypothetical protein
MAPVFANTGREGTGFLFFLGAYRQIENNTAIADF